MNMLPTAAASEKGLAKSLGHLLNRKLSREEIRHEVMIRRGLYSAEAIATIIGNGATRNSVIGIWHRECKRLGLPSLAPKPKQAAAPKMGRRYPAAPPRPQANREKTPPAHITKALPPPPPPALVIEPLRLRLFELADDGCRQILDEPSDTTLYCGLKATRGSFCEGHAQLNYSRGAPRKIDPSSKPGPKPRSKPKFSVFALRAI